MTLYDIDSKILSFIENGFVLDEETGEIFDTDAFVEELEDERSKKIENIALYIKNLVSDIEEIKKAKANLNDLQQSKQKRIDRLKAAIEASFKIHGERKFEGTFAKISLRSSAAVNIENEQDFIEWARKNADDLLTYKEPTVSKSAVKNALDSGRDLPGVSIESKNNVLIK